MHLLVVVVLTALSLGVELHCPHQNLGGLTPMEAWQGQTRADVMRRAGRGEWVSALDGRLFGYRLRR
jgi:hypothetical protein